MSYMSLFMTTRSTHGTETGQGEMSFALPVEVSVG